MKLLICEEEFPDLFWQKAFPAQYAAHSFEVSISKDVLMEILDRHDSVTLILADLLEISNNEREKERLEKARNKLINLAETESYEVKE